jgi:predicted dehydrogenase
MHTTRRTFVKLAAAATAAPFILPSRIWSAETGPNGLINMAFIGVGKQNRDLLGNFLHRAIKVRAVCDVDTNRRNAALQAVQQFHAQDAKRGAADCVATGDFREVMARKDIDAVCIATPDHWHALITLAALRSGKDVYCEKPLTHNIHEAVEVMAAVGRHKRVLQTGSMQRSMSEFRVACELVRNGVIGKVDRVECKVGAPGRPCDLPEEPMEPGLDWDRWLGPAPSRPYHSALSPRGVHDHYPAWRSYLEFGGGGITDFGAHHFDIAQWGLGMDESGPVEVRPPEDSASTVGAVMVYAGGANVTQVSGGPDIRFIGAEGEAQASRGSFAMTKDGERIDSQHVAEKRFLAESKVLLYRSTNHVDDFLARVADRKRPVSSEVEGGHTAICCHLINLAYYHRQKLRWDPKRFLFVGNTGRNSWLTRDYRKPWRV